ncbi:hypothetical protein BK130_20930 [Viridibacillus sp. FSL H8-0123]|nr:hypothetical protein BK130_20930 [Viridibacillus sp. FSL H8-0123]
MLTTSPNELISSLLIGSDIGIMIGLVFLQCVLGLMQPIYSSISFSLIPEISKEDELVEANGLLETTLRLMSIIAPGITSL